MRKQKDLVPNRYKTIETSGSSKFVSTFSKKDISDVIVEKRDRSYNWEGYKWALLFTVIVGIITYSVLEILM